MDKIDHLMAEKNENNKESQKGHVTPKKYLKKNNLKREKEKKRKRERKRKRGRSKKYKKRDE
jgi:hypothetical protein